MLLTYFSLAKPRILILVTVAALATAIVAGEGEFSPGTGILLALAVGLSSAGASFINNYFDRDIDAVMERTRNRPLPGGKIAPAPVVLTGLALIAVSILIALRINHMTALFIMAGALIYAALYTLWLKRRTSLNIVFGGLSGSCAALAGWFAGSTQFSILPLMIALLLFLWTPSHFWSFALVHQDSYRQAGIPMLPVLAGPKKTSILILISTGVLLLASVMLYLLAPFGQVYLIGSVILGALFLGSSVRLWIRPDKQKAWSNFKFSGIYLFGLFLIMALDGLLR